jgi:hypothetical protein
MKRLIILWLVLATLTSCDLRQLRVLITKTPKIEYAKPANYDSLNKYQKDAVFLTELIKNSYPELELKIPDEDYSFECKKLISDLSVVESDLDFQVRVRKFMVLLKDGHSDIGIIPPESEGYFYLDLYKEINDWKILNIARNVDSSVIGSTIVSINQIPIDEIETRINQFECVENPFRAYSKFLDHALIPLYWEAMGVIEKKGDLNLTLVKDSMKRTVTIQPKAEGEFHKIAVEKWKYPFTRQQNDGFYYKVDTIQNFAYLQMNTSLDYVSVKSDIKTYTNFITRPIALMVMKNHTKYARDFGLVLQSMFQEITKHSIDNVIIDLRNNWGGDLRPGKQLVWYLTEQQEIKGFTEYRRISDYYKSQFKQEYKQLNAIYQEKYGKPIPYGIINITDTILNQNYFYDITKEDSPFLLDHSLPKFQGNVYVLIGVNTFSAGAALATTIADNNLATIVGKPTGQKPTSQSGVSLLKLPHTKSMVTISCAYVERPNKLKNHEIALFPDIEIYPTLEDFLSGVDVQFEYIINEIKK